MGPRRTWLLLISAAFAFSLDVATKLLAVDRLEGRRPVELLGGLIELRLTRNSGAAFGIAQGATVIFTLVAALVVVVILRVAARLRSAGWAVALGLVLGGATGNLGDRLFRDPGPLRGHVVDWIELPHWPVFNLADASIVCGAALALLLSFRGIGFDGSRPPPAHGADGSETPAAAP